MKSIKHVFGFTKPKKAKKIRTTQLRKMIAEELRILREQEEGGEAAADSEVPEPKGEAFTGQTSFKGVDANEVAAQVLTRDPEQPIFKAMEFTDGDGDDAKVVKPDPNKVADWLEGIGVGEFVSRVQAVGSKIPGTGLPKSDMPFLPGPKDASGEVSDVVDALSPGGEYNVNFESVKRGLNYLVEQAEEEQAEAPAGEETELSTTPPSKNSFVGLDSEEAQTYMTAGNKDGNESDDNIAIQVGGGFPAADGIPTQTNILLPKALGMAVAGVSGGNLKAYASTNNEILDGHHRWAATMLNDPGANIGTIAKIDMDKLGMDTTLKHLTAIGNALGNKTKTESRRRANDDNLVMERWRRLAGIL